MRRFLAAIGLLSCAVLPLRSVGQSAGDAFKDLPVSHWAYTAADKLRAHGVITGYPEAYFRGRRALTRYEFALALDRVLGRIALRGEGAPEALAPSSTTNADIDTLRSLTSEFQAELAIVGTTAATTRAKLEKLQHDAAEARKHPSKPPALASAPSTPKRVDPIPAGASAAQASAARRQTGAPVHPAGPSVGLGPGKRSAAGPLGGGYGILSMSAPAQDQLSLRPGLLAAGPATSFNAARLQYSLGDLATLSPREERAFAEPRDDGSTFGADGMRLATHVGSVVVEAFAGQAYTVRGSLGMKTDGSVLGADSRSAAPSALLGSSSQFAVGSLGGVSLRIPMGLLRGGHIQFTSIGPTGLGTHDSTESRLLGAETELRVTKRLTLTGEWAQTGVPQGFSAQDGQTTAYSGALGYRSGPLRLSASYKYVDPLFYAPGYWGRIGGWLNPTNIQGPGFRAAYEGSRFGLTLGGDFYSGARDRDSLGGLSTNDDMTRILVGVRWNLSRNLRANLDWEGVYWRLNSQVANLPSLAGNSTPREQYVTISTGYNLSSSTLLRLGYQRGGLINGGSAAGPTSVSTFTGQMAIKF